MFTCSATFALACQIAVWLGNANATLLPPYWRFEPHHIKAIVDTAYEESRFRPCIKSRDGSVGLWQWRGSRREAPVFFAARDYWTARSIFVRRFEVRRADLIRRAGL